MTYTPTTWVDGVTPLNAVNMNKIEAGISAAVPTFNVRWYGAVGDNVANDTAAIQAAATAANAVSGGVVYFPPGTYKITSPILLPSGAGGFSGVGAMTFQGAHRNSTCIEQATANTAVFTTSGSGTFTQSITFCDLRIQQATQASTSDTLAYGVAIAGGSVIDVAGFTFERCWINRCYVGIGISATSGSIAFWNLRVSDCWITSTRHNAIKLVSPVAVGMPSNHFEHLYVANTGVGNDAGAIVSDSFAFDFIGATVTMTDIDLEGWYNAAIRYAGNSQAMTVRGMYLEHHVFNNASVYGSVPPLFDLSSDAIFDGFIITATTVGAIGAYMFSVTGANLHLRGVATNLTIGGGGYATAINASGAARVYYDGDWRAVAGAINIPTDAGSAALDTIVGGARTLAYSATIATDASVASSTFRVIPTNGTAFTISTPTNPVTGRRITYDIKNSSGGAMGAVTWGAAFLLAGAFTNPANGKRRTISFYYDGTNWVETNRAAADI